MTATITPVNPWSWSEAFGCEQATLVDGATRTLYCAGQTSVDADGNPDPRRRHGGHAVAVLSVQASGGV